MSGKIFSSIYLGWTKLKQAVFQGKNLKNVVTLLALQLLTTKIQINFKNCIQQNKMFRARLKKRQITLHFQKIWACIWIVSNKNL